ncbi:MAG TPA: HAMP domain-containing protein, partial [Deinococcales bacterium]|nr:HAMP domain-containing protein [Deinococcales bacterium]
MTPARDSVRWRLMLAFAAVALLAVAVMAALGYGASLRAQDQLADLARARLDAPGTGMMGAGPGMTGAGPGMMTGPGRGMMGLLGAAAEAPLGAQRDATLLAAGIAALGAVVAGAGVALRLTRPLERLARGAARLEAGEYGLTLSGEGRDEFGRLTRAFNSLSAGLSREQSARRAMVADIAHDLRTPVSVLRSRLEALQDGVVTPGPAVIAGLIDQTLLLGRMVEDLRTLSLADVNALELHPERLDARAFLEALAPAWPGVTLTLPPAGLAVTADRARLAQALGNLLANAGAHGAPPV